MPNVIDLFCGCGGFSLGFERAGFDVLLGIDVWKDAIKTYSFNHKKSNSLIADLSSLNPSEIENLLNGKDIDVIIGGPPCQGFSVAGKRIIDDDRNKLYKSFVRFVAFFRPKAFVMENVPNILSMGNGIIKENILKDFENLGYTVEYRVVVASDYGVPQNRKRAFFVGITKEGHFVFPNPLLSDKITVKEAVSDLPDYSVVDGGTYPMLPQSDYQKLMRCNSLSLNNHQVTEHTKQTKEIISLVPDGGNYKDLPENLQSIRHVHIAWTRLNSKKPSITIDTGHRHHFHYQYNRIPTVRESARIQSFPDDFYFTCSRTSQFKQVGNAVPPLLAESIAKSLLHQI